MASATQQHFEPELLARVTGGRWTQKPHADLAGFAFDARVLQPGEVFIALSCGQRDGHDFVVQAGEQGDAAAMVERAQPVDLPQLVVRDSLAAMAALGRDCRDRFSGPVIGVTGSSGKTSTKEMLRLLLGAAATHATAGNWNNRIGVPMTLFGLHGSEQSFAVIEAGINQPGEMAQLGRMIGGDLTILTNIGYAHLELLGTQAGIAEEKSQLAVFARPESPLVLPAAALRYPALAALAPRCLVLAGEKEVIPAAARRVIRYRLSPGDERGTTAIHLADRDDETSFHLHSMSGGMARNAALALVAARELGVADGLLRERLVAWRPGRDRGHFFQEGGNFYYTDCYNANPDSMADALDTFGRVAPPEMDRYYLLGAMNELGPRAPELHQQSASGLSLRPQDRAVFIGPQPLTSAYATAVREAGADPDQFSTVENTLEAKSIIAGSRGAFFLKGSRSYRLELLLPAALRPPSAPA